MVRPSLLDSPPESPSLDCLDLPPRMFAVGEEPKGIRVSAYHTSSAIRTVLKALTEEEVQFLRNSAFGKFISLVQEPTLSGRFGRFLMSSQLKTKKKHELWFLFAGKPVRYSLREFALVTGLRCGKYPRKSKKRLRKNITETPYWPSLFGSCDAITALEVIKMLKRRTVTDKEIRLKYACLALLSYAVIPTTHHPKIQKEHAELIKDLDEFFAYPWGRLSFDLLMKNIKDRNEISLSQDTIAVPGFALSLQLVMAAAVPALKEVVEEQSEASGSDEDDDDDEEEGEQVPANKRVRITLSPGHARDLSKDSKTVVQSILPDDPDNPLSVDELGWSDDEDDTRVDNMIKLISEGHLFRKSMFTGGATKADVVQMRDEAKAKKAAEMEAKRQKKGKAAVVPNTDVDTEQVAAMVVDQMKAVFRKVEEKVEYSTSQVADLKKAFKIFQVDIKKEIQLEVGLLQEIKQLISDNRNSASLYPTSRFQNEDGQHVGEASQDNNGTRTPVFRTDRTDQLLSEVIGSVNACHRHIPDTRRQSPVDDLIGNGCGNVNFPNNEGPSGGRSVGQDDARMEDTFVEPESLNEQPSVHHPTERNSTSPERSTGGRVFHEDNHHMGDEGADFGPSLFDEPPIILPYSSVNGEGCTGQPLRDLDMEDNSAIRDEHNGRIRVDGDHSHVGQETPQPRVCEPPIIFGHPSTPPPEGTADKEKGDVHDDGEEARSGWIISTEPSFSIGLTQEESDDFDTPSLHRVREAHMSANQGQDTVDFSQKYKDLCQQTKNKFTIKVGGISISNKDIDSITARSGRLAPKVVDALMHYTRSLFATQEETGKWKRMAFFDSKFAPCLAKTFTKFSNARNKETYRFPKELIRYFEVSGTRTMFAQCYYFPCTVEKDHWVGICVDYQTKLLLVLDCNISLRSDADMAAALNPIAEMFPYLLKQAGRCLTFRDLLPLQVQRAQHVPQNISYADSAITSVLLIQSHAIGGVDICRCITPESIDVEAQRLAVLLYDTYK